MEYCKECGDLVTKTIQGYCTGCANYHLIKRAETSRRLSVIADALRDIAYLNYLVQKKHKPHGVSDG